MILDSGITGAGLFSKTPVVLQPVTERRDAKNIGFNDRFGLKNMNFLFILRVTRFEAAECQQVIAVEYKNGFSVINGKASAMRSHGTSVVNGEV